MALTPGHRRERPYFFRRGAAGFLAVLQAVTAAAAPLGESHFWRERQARGRSVQEAPRVSAPSRSPFLPPRGPSLPWLTSALGDHADLREVFLSPDPRAPWVVYVQDVHGVVEVQRHMAAVVAGVARERPGLTVGVEGAAGAFDFSLFHAAAPPAAARAAELLLRLGYLTGAEFSAAVSSTPLTLWGVEDRPLYQAHVAAFQASRSRRPSAERALAVWREELAQRRAVLFDPPLARADEWASQRQAARVSLREYVEGLGRLYPPDPEKFPQLAAFRNASQRETSLDFARVERERRRLAERLAPLLSAEELRTLADRPRNPDFLYRLCRAHGVPWDDFPALKEYRRYAALADGIDRASFLLELEGWEQAAGRALARTPAQRRLWALSRAADGAGRLVEHAMTAPGWNRYTQLKESLRATPGEAAPLFDGTLTPFEDFCRDAVNRNEALANGLPLRPGDTALLVAGGFHTEGLVRTLRLRGASYAVVTPRLGAPGETNPLSDFTRAPWPLERVLGGEAVSLSYPLLWAREPLQEKNRSVRWRAARLLAGAMIALNRSPSDPRAGITGGVPVNLPPPLGHGVSYNAEANAPGHPQEIVVAEVPLSVDGNAAGKALGGTLILNQEITTDGKGSRVLAYALQMGSSLPKLPLWPRVTGGRWAAFSGGAPDVFPFDTLELPRVLPAIFPSEEDEARYVKAGFHTHHVHAKDGGVISARVRAVGEGPLVVWIGGVGDGEGLDEDIIEKLDGRPVVAVTRRPDVPLGELIERSAEDILTVLQATPSLDFHRRGLVLIGHSMGAHVAQEIRRELKEADPSLPVGFVMITPPLPHHHTFSVARQWHEMTDTVGHVLALAAGLAGGPLLLHWVHGALGTRWLRSLARANVIDWGLSVAGRVFLSGMTRREREVFALILYLYKKSRGRDFLTYLQDEGKNWKWLGVVNGADVFLSDMLRRLAREAPPLANLTRRVSLPPGHGFWSPANPMAWAYLPGERTGERVGSYGEWLWMLVTRGRGDQAFPPEHSPHRHDPWSTEVWTMIRHLMDDVDFEARLVAWIREHQSQTGGGVLVVDKDDTLTDPHQPISQESLDSVVRALKVGVRVVLHTASAFGDAQTNVLNPLRERLSAENREDLLTRFLVITDLVNFWSYNTETRRYDLTHTMDIFREAARGALQGLARPDRLSWMKRVSGDAVHRWTALPIQDRRTSKAFLKNIKSKEPGRVVWGWVEALLVQKSAEWGERGQAVRILWRGQPGKTVFQVTVSGVLNDPEGRLRQSMADELNAAFHRFGILLSAFPSGRTSIDITRSGVSKLTRLNTLAAQLGISPSQVMFIDDKKRAKNVRPAAEEAGLFGDASGSPENPLPARAAGPGPTVILPGPKGVAAFIGFVAGVCAPSRQTGFFSLGVAMALVVGASGFLGGWPVAVAASVLLATARRWAESRAARPRSGWSPWDRLADPSGMMNSVREAARDPARARAPLERALNAGAPVGGGALPWRGWEEKVNRLGRTNRGIKNSA